MLKFFRKGTRIIIWTIALGFVLYGGFMVGLQMQEKKDRFAGEVFGKKVTFQEFNRFYRSSQIFSFGGKPIEDVNLLRQQAWQSIIFSKEAASRKIQVTDDDVRAEIMRLLSVQKIDNPSPEIYQNWLKNTIRETPQEFEAQIRELLKVQKLIREVNAKTDLPKTDLEKLAQQKFVNDHLMISAEAIIFPTKEAAESFHKKATSEASWLEAVQKDSLKPQATGMISLSSMISDETSEKSAKQLFELKKGDISQPLELRKSWFVFHVLDKQTGSGEQYTDETKTKYIQEIQNKLTYEKFIVWSSELIQKAHLKDFMPPPDATPPPPAPEPAAETATPKTEAPATVPAIPAATAVESAAKTAAPTTTAAPVAEAATKTAPPPTTPAS